MVQIHRFCVFLKYLCLLDELLVYSVGTIINKKRPSLPDCAVVISEKKGPLVPPYHAPLASYSHSGAISMSSFHTTVPHSTLAFINRSTFLSGA